MNVRNAGRWTAAVLLLAMAPVPVTAGRHMLADRGATPVTAALVALGVAATILCLLGCVTVFRLADPNRPHRPARQPARHTTGRRR